MRPPPWHLAAAILVLAWLLAAATTPAAADRWAPHTPYTSPVSPLDVVRTASLPAQNWLPGHRGIDLAAPAGATVVSPAAGIVSFAGDVVDRPVLSIRHDDGGLTSLEPVTASVTVGARVARGAPVGVVAQGSSHCPGQACVHWGVRVDGRYVDPLDVLAGYGPVRLLASVRDPLVAVSRRRRCATATRAASSRLPSGSATPGTR